MTAVSAVPALLDALVALFAAALPNVTVFDGPGLTDHTAGDYLFVGVADPDSDAGESAVETTVEWGGLGSRLRHEQITVRCAAVSWSGDEDVHARRVAAYATFAAVEQALTADPSVGDVARFGGLATEHQLKQNNTDDGAEAWVQFAMQFTARLSG